MHLASFLAVAVMATPVPEIMDHSDIYEVEISQRHSSTFKWHKL
jgi:hypothetical protein